MTHPDPNWTPKEPRRPFRPKPGAFGVEKSFPIDDIPTLPTEDIDLIGYKFPPEDEDGPED